VPSGGLTIEMEGLLVALVNVPTPLPRVAWKNQEPKQENVLYSHVLHVPPFDRVSIAP
jgi:hypothetical protein